jgi:hypothetical protein
MLNQIHPPRNTKINRPMAWPRFSVGMRKMVASAANAEGLLAGEMAWGAKAFQTI